MNPTIRRTPITSRIPADIDYRVNNITQFGGITQSDNPLIVKNNTAMDMKNLYVDENGVLTTRPRTSLKQDYSKNIKASIVIDDILYILTSDNILYKQAGIDSATLTIIPMESDLIEITDLKNGFIQNGITYILGNDFFLIDPKTNKLNFVYDSEYVYIPFAKEGVRLDQNQDLFDTSEPYNILSSKYKISYYWDGLTSLKFAEKGRLVENNNMIKKYLPDKSFGNGYTKHLSDDYMLQWTQNNIYLIKVNSDLTTTDLLLTVSGLSAPISDVAMSDDRKKLAIVDADWTRLRFFNYDEASNTVSDATIVDLSGNNFYAGSTLAFNEDGTMLAYWPQNDIRVVNLATNTTRSVRASETAANRNTSLIWKGSKLYALSQEAFCRYDITLSTISLDKEIEDVIYVGSMALNADGTKVAFTSRETSDANLRIIDTTNWNVLLNTDNRPETLSCAFNSADDLYLSSGSQIGVLYFVNGAYEEYSMLIPPSSDDAPVGRVLKVIDGKIWNETVLYWYEDTVEPGIIVEYDQQESMKDFVSTDIVWQFRIPFVSKIANFENVSKNYYITQGEFVGPALFEIDLNKYGTFSQDIYNASTETVSTIVYTVSENCVEILEETHPDDWFLLITGAKPTFSFSTLKNIFNKYHFAYKNRDYFQNKSHTEMYIPDYNICGDDRPIKDYGILNSEYAIILKQRGAFLLTIDDNGYETYVEFKSDIGTDYASSLMSSYNNTFFFANKTGVYNLTTVSNISVFDQVTVNVSEQILRLFNSITNKNKLITVSDEFWTYFIYPDTNLSKILIFDGRLSQWFYWEIKNNIVLAYIRGGILHLLTTNGLLLEMATTELLNEYNPEITEYYDYGKVEIDWFWKSQIMSLGTINKHKQLATTSFIMTDTDAQDEFGLNYKLKIFRKYMSESGEETINARLNYIGTTTKRTYVARFNFVQLELENVPGALEQNKLRLIGLIFKFRILGGVI